MSEGQPTSVPITDGLVRGALELERTERGLRPHRLPGRARARCDDPQLHQAEAQPSGVRLAFRTAATVVELETRRTVIGFHGAPPRPDGIYDLLVDGRLAARASTAGGDALLIDPTTGARETRPGPTGTVRFDGLPAAVKDVELWLPHDELTELVALRADASVAPLPPGGRPVWLHHGSSISNGSNAAGPSQTWPALAASQLGLDLVNLGFSGSALLDPFTARAMRDTPADAVSIKIGINVANADLMRRRAFAPAVHGFLDTIRDGHPDVPLVVVSALYCPIHEETPGPGAVEMVDGAVRFRATGDPAEVVDGPTGRLSLRVIRSEIARVVAERADDRALHHLDGLALYGPDDHEVHPLPDRLHPDAVTHRIVGERFARLAGDVLSPARPPR